MKNKPIYLLTLEDFVGLYRIPKEGKILFQLEIMSSGEFIIRGTDSKEIDRGRIEFLYDEGMNELYAILKDSIKVKISEVDKDGFCMTFPNENEFQTFPRFHNFWKINKGEINIAKIVYARI